MSLFDCPLSISLKIPYNVTMSIRNIIISAIILVLFLAMGNNPMDAPEDYVPPDEFKEGIQNRINGMGPGLGGFGDSAMGALGMGGNNAGSGNSAIPGGLPGTVSGNNAGYINPYNYGNEGSNGGGFGRLSPSPVVPDVSDNPVYPSPGYPQQQSPSYNMPQSAPTPPPPPGQPEPFRNLPMPNSNLYQGIENLFAATIESGAPVKFVGTQVYTLNESGKIILLPDGRYMKSDGIPLVVKGGKRQWPETYGFSRPKVYN